MLRRAAELDGDVDGDGSGDGGGGGGGDGGIEAGLVDKSEAGLVDGSDAGSNAAVGVGGEGKDDDAGGVAEADFETDGIFDTVGDGDTRIELEIAVRCMNDVGLSNFLRSAVGGSMKGQSLGTCLSRTVSVAQYTYEKVVITHFIPF